MKDFKELLTSCILGGLLVLIIFWLAQGLFAGVPPQDAQHEYEVASSVQASLHGN